MWKRGSFTREDPKTSLILLSFNHRRNVELILERLRRTSADELVICDDGSIDGSDMIWLRNLVGRNEFLIRSHDLHEIRAYNRAIDFARGEIVCVLQDDDIPPEYGDWVEHATALFNRYPRLAILGGFRGNCLDLRYGAPKKATSNRKPQVDSVRPIPFADPVLEYPFMFIKTANIGPLFFKREVFQSLGGFDAHYSVAGEPGIRLDDEICLRAWTSGWQVGLFGPPVFRRDVGGKGTFLFGKLELKRNKRANLERLMGTYESVIPEIDRAIEELNSELRPHCVSRTLEEC